MSRVSLGLSCSMNFLTGFTDNKSGGDLIEERGSDIDTGVSLKGFYLSLTFSYESGSNVYQDVLYV